MKIMMHMFINIVEYNQSNVRKKVENKKIVDHGYVAYIKTIKPSYMV